MYQAPRSSNGDVHGDVGLPPVQLLLHSHRHVFQGIPVDYPTLGLTLEDTEVDFGDCPALNKLICRPIYINIRVENDLLFIGFNRTRTTSLGEKWQ